MVQATREYYDACSGLPMTKEVAQAGSINEMISTTNDWLKRVSDQGIMKRWAYIDLEADEIKEETDEALQTSAYLIGFNSRDQMIQTEIASIKNESTSSGSDEMKYLTDTKLTTENKNKYREQIEFINGE